MSDFDSEMNVRQSTFAHLKATVIGNGTAGTPDANPVTVQGIASMTPLLVSNVDADISGVPLGTSALRAFGSVAGITTGSASATALATAAVLASKTAYIRSFKGVSSGLAKFELLGGADYATGVDIAAPIMTGPGNLSHRSRFDPPLPFVGPVGNGAITIKGTNRDNGTQDLYGEIEAYVTP